ncbi:MAG: M20 family metallopeptidase [Patescibacteria group bacterium]|jgi:acetylornithine deacetylase
MAKTKKSVVDLLIDLINVPSISENEQALCRFIYRFLSKLSFDQIERQVVDDRGFNIVAQSGQPKIFLQAHMDTVPPFIKAKRKEEKIFGRGACDTKSCLASMIVAANKALDQNLTNFGLIFTVGEETNFRGVKKIVEKYQNLPFVIVGEPTKLKPVNGHFGIGTIMIKAKGKAVHTSIPEQGINAIEKLLVGLDKLASFSPQRGSLLSLVKISGGMAENVVPDQAQALYNFRISPQDKGANYPAKFKQILSGTDLSAEPGLILLPVKSVIPKNLAFLGSGETVSYATELSFFKKGLVLGPGNIKWAHSKNEFIKIKELEEAVNLYEKIITAYQ